MARSTRQAKPSVKPADNKRDDEIRQTDCSEMQPENRRTELRPGMNFMLGPFAVTTSEVYRSPTKHLRGDLGEFKEKEDYS